MGSLLLLLALLFARSAVHVHKCMCLPACEYIYAVCVRSTHLNNNGVSLPLCRTHKSRNSTEPSPLPPFPTLERSGSHSVHHNPPTSPPPLWFGGDCGYATAAGVVPLIVVIVNVYTQHLHTQHTSAGQCDVAVYVFNMCPYVCGRLNGDLPSRDVE